MKTFTPKDLKEILAKHAAFLRGENCGERADLQFADLRSANLRSANLRFANLREISLLDIVGNMGAIRSIQIETYAIAYTFEVLQIGCERHKIEEWDSFGDERIIRMDSKSALKFWRKWKSTIMQIIEMAPADKWEYKPKV